LGDELDPSQVVVGKPIRLTLDEMVGKCLEEPGASPVGLGPLLQGSHGIERRRLGLFPVGDKRGHLTCVEVSLATVVLGAFGEMTLQFFATQLDLDALDHVFLLDLTIVRRWCDGSPGMGLR
jgi:hypothetical protein